MKRSSRPRTTVELSKSFQQQLNVYALAATAAGVGMLAQSAEGKIAYTPAHHLIKKNAQYRLDLNHDGVADITFVNYYSCNFDYCYEVLNANPAAGNGVEGAKGALGIPYAYALKRGAQIGSKHPFSGQMMASWNSGSRGGWSNITDRYLGLHFQINGKTHYGWARLSVQVGSVNINATLTGYAYETIPNKPIIAGKTKGPDAITVQPASLGHLAAGASAIPAWHSGK
jgi:hypothetical protein